jgi:DNA repair protein RadA/Sms
MVIGEVGLAGEVRGIAQPEIRVREAAKLGFGRCILPGGNLRKLKSEGVELVGVSSVEQALEALF